MQLYTFFKRIRSLLLVHRPNDILLLVTFSICIHSFVYSSIHSVFSQPVTCYIISAKAAPLVAVSHKAMKNKRRKMEDRTVLVHDLSAVTDKKVMYFGHLKKMKAFSLFYNQKWLL